MYTGIIKHTGSVVSIEDFGIGRHLTIAARWAFVRPLCVGDSVNVDGVCFTIRKKRFRRFMVEAMPQTLRVTSVGSWKVGKKVNLEDSVRMGEALGGHFVYGHVDAIGTVKQETRDGRALILGIVVPEKIRSFLPVRASVAVNGVSLTVISRNDGLFTVSLLPDTTTRTNLGEKKPGDVVNIEIDMIARYALEHIQSHPAS